jgi:hypothetical protein
MAKGSGIGQQKSQVSISFLPFHVEGIDVSFRARGVFFFYQLKDLNVVV